MWKRIWFVKNGEILQGNFITWGYDFEGASHAIVSLDNGKVEMVYPTLMQFQEPGGKCVLDATMVVSK